MGIQELITYWQIIKKRLWLIALLMGTTLGVLLLIFYLSKPEYKASTLFQVSSPLPLEVSIYTEFGRSTSRDELIYTRNNFIAVLQSELVIRQVIETLGLRMSVEEFRGRMQVQPTKDSDFIILSFTAQDPKLAQSTANTLMAKATQYYGGLDAGSITTNKTFIQEQLQKTKKGLDEAMAALIQFQMQHRTGSLESLLKSQEALITDLKSKRDQALAEGKALTAASYDQIIAERERELQAQIPLISEYVALQGNVDRKERTYADLLDKETEAELKENEILSAKFIQVVPAHEPSLPLPRVKIAILALGGVASLALGVALAFILEYLDGVAAATREDDQAHSRRTSLENVARI